ncbi:unnamed protein product [Adineta ricciae]|uniref:MULE transposase domain-containing protein n=1 Tax=Adineta ricciae TaxID=249248 RepID=A0A816EHK5_ADIRI|nr:unnamed protein product [Adineta ricciae]
MDETFVKQLCGEKTIVTPFTSSPLSSKAFLFQTAPKLPHSPVLSQSDSLAHGRLPSAQWLDSLDSSWNINDDGTDPQCGEFISDAQYEVDLQGEITFGESTKQKPIIFMSGYSYLFMSAASKLGTTGYRCARKDLKCPATIHIYTNNNTFQRWNRKRHVHPPDPIDRRRRLIIATIKKPVISEHIPVCSIVEQEYTKAKLTKEEQVVFKNPKQLESGLLKSRRKMYPPLPTCQNFMIRDFMLTTTDSTRFLLFDDTRDEFGGRLLVFSSKHQINLLLKYDMADGTFRSCSRLFEQVYVIMAVKYSKTYPVLFALTTNREQETYCAMIDVINTEARNRGVSFAPHTFISDYERAWMNAVNQKVMTIFLTLETDCIYRWIQTNGLAKTYEEHEENRQIFRSFMALSLLPKDRVHEGFHIVKVVRKGTMNFVNLYIISSVNGSRHLNRICGVLDHHPFVPIMQRNVSALFGISNHNSRLYLL